MGITIGQQLGSYEISLSARPVWVEVYRGRDTKVKREVADRSGYHSGYGTGARANLAAWSRNISTRLRCFCARSVRCS
jgi:hypothetical protein